MIKRFLSFALAASLFSGPAVSGPESDMLQAQLLPGWRAPDGTHVAALHITLKKGWKTYWRSPGEAGIPPQFDWRGSRNLQAVNVVWPTPKLFDQSGIESIGYAESMTLPLRIKPAKAGQDVELAGDVDIGVCKDICVPVKIPVTQVLPMSSKKPDPRIVAALANQPNSAGEAGVSHVSCQLKPVNGGMRLSAVITMPALKGRETLVVESGDPNLWVAQFPTKREGGKVYTEAELYHVQGKPFALNRSNLRFTVLGNGQAVDIKGCS